MGTAGSPPGGTLRPVTKVLWLRGDRAAGAVLQTCSAICATAVRAVLPEASYDGREPAAPDACVHCAWCGELVDVPEGLCLVHDHDGCPTQAWLASVLTRLVAHQLATEHRRALSEVGWRRLVALLQADRDRHGHVDPTRVLNAFTAAGR